MSYNLTYQVQVNWVNDGGGPIGQRPIGPTLEFQGSQGVPGFSTPGTTPTGANFNTACVAMGADISAQIQVAAVLARIQGFGNGTTQ